MTASTLLAYLLGRRTAILDVAACPQAVWLGLPLVLSAALAREYDGQDLLREPWHLLLPLAASLATSLLLYCLLWSVARGFWWRKVSFLGGYRSFLGLYWMTAPLAWLYAIPVERFLSPAAATQANLCLLGVVAVWRVLLMTRVVSVAFRCPPAASLFVVMLFAEAVAMVLLYFAPKPVFALMGGIRLTPSEQIIQGTIILVGALAYLSAPIWLLGTINVAASRWRPREPIAALQSPARRVSRSAWGLALAALAVWPFVLPFTQSEQQLRRVVDDELREGRIREALAIMNLHRRDDFPPHWDPPPRVGYGEQEPSPLAVMELLVATQNRPWVRELFSEKYQRLISAGSGPFTFWNRIDDEQFQNHLRLLERLPHDSPILARQRELVENGRRISLRSESQQQRLRRLLGLEDKNPDEENRDEEKTPTDEDGINDDSINDETAKRAPFPTAE